MRAISLCNWLVLRGPDWTWRSFIDSVSLMATLKWWFSPTSASPSRYWSNLKLPLQLHRAKCRIRDQALSLDPRAWWRVALLGQTFSVGDRWMWGNGGLMICRGRKQKNWEKNPMYCYFPSRILLLVTWVKAVRRQDLAASVGRSLRTEVPKFWPHRQMGLLRRIVK